MTSRDNYKRWLRVVGLDFAALKKIGLEKEFPDLIDLDDNLLTSKLDPFSFRAEKIQKIKNEIRKNQTLRVPFLPGMGCTTLFRFLVLEMEETSDETGLAVVGLSLKELADTESFKAGTFTELDLEEKMKRRIITTLTSERWENIADQDCFFDMLGFKGNPRDFPQYRDRIRNLVGSGSTPLSELGPRCPITRMPMSEVLGKLLTTARVTTLVMTDMSGAIPSTRLRLFFSAVKGFKDRMSEVLQSAPAAYRECYFMTRNVAVEWDGFLGITPGTLPEEPWDDYLPSEIFVILQKQYASRVSPDAFEYRVTAPILDEEVLAFAKQRARSRNVSAGLREIAAELRSVIEECMADQVRVCAKLNAAQRKELESGSTDALNL